MGTILFLVQLVSTQEFSAYLLLVKWFWMLLELSLVFCDIFKNEHHSREGFVCVAFRHFFQIIFRLSGLRDIFYYSLAYKSMFVNNWVFSSCSNLKFFCYNSRDWNISMSPLHYLKSEI